ncbi:MAG: chorismate mutase, partial [Ignavibacterium sp.]|nr:chorismate mutase [Ignavibacterium sp.]
IICDPSHICGTRDLIPFIAQKALDLDMAGLMIESHIHPDAAWSDAKQQVTPAALRTIVAGLIKRKPEVAETDNEKILQQLRDQIDKLDDEIMQRLAERMKISRKIGAYKKEKNIKTKRIIKNINWVKKNLIGKSVFTFIPILKYKIVNSNEMINHAK